MDRSFGADRFSQPPPDQDTIYHREVDPRQLIVEPGTIYSVGPTDDELRPAEHNGTNIAPESGLLAAPDTIPSDYAPPHKAAAYTLQAATTSVDTLPTEAGVQEPLKSALIAAEVCEARQLAYPRPPKHFNDGLPPNYEKTGTCFTEAGKYLATVLPGVQAEPLSNEGRTAIVMQDGRFVYKVFRNQNRGYDQVENEAAALTVLHREGITPRPVILLDAASSQRYADRYTKPVRPLFGNELRIARYETDGRLPIIVAERKNIGPIADLPPEARNPEFKRFAEVALKHNLLYSDCRIHHDRETDRAIIVDVGEVQDHKKGPIDRNNRAGFFEGLEHYPDSILHEAELAWDVLGRFFPKGVERPSFTEAVHRYAYGGLDAVAAMLNEKW